MSDCLARRKILILSGASVHCKLVEEAKKYGLYTIVTDNLIDSPAKRLSDESWSLSVTAVDNIVEKCKEEGVDAIVCGWIDPCQIPYVKICQKLNLPCYGNLEQFTLLTNKSYFKEKCVANEVCVIPEYSIQDVENEQVSYPVFIKPADSRGSRGQEICRTKDEALKAIKLAATESSSNTALIEKYIEGEAEFQVTYFFIDGEAYLIRTADSYVDENQVGLDRVVSYSISPSKYTDDFISKASPALIGMLKNIGVKNGPVFFQGFYNRTENRFCFFDPGYRFPGTDFEKILKNIFKIDFAFFMVFFSINGYFPKIDRDVDYFHLNGKHSAVLFPAVKPGLIKSVEGLLELGDDEAVVSVLERSKAGDRVFFTKDIGQRLAEIDVLCENKGELLKKIEEIYHKITVRDFMGRDMLVKPLRYIV